MRSNVASSRTSESQPFTQTRIRPCDGARVRTSPSGCDCPVSHARPKKPDSHAVLGLQLADSAVAGATKNRNPTSPADILSLSFRIRTVVKRTVTVCVIVVNSPAYASILVPFASDRKSTRLNSSHSQISYAVFCLKKKNNLLT